MFDVQAPVRRPIPAHFQMVLNEDNRKFGRRAALHFDRPGALAGDPQKKPIWHAEDARNF